MSGRQPWGLMPTIVVALLLVGGGFALYTTGAMNPPGVSAEDLNSVLLVAASPDEGGAAVAQIIVELDLTATGVDVSAVSPALPVTIPGTSFSALGDAYPFAGGSGVAVALARARGDEKLPFVSLDAEALAELVERAGGVRVDLPSAMSVFDGEQLYSFKAGAQTLSAGQLQAVLKGAPYLRDADRARLDDELAEALVAALADNPDALDDGDTDLGNAALARLKDAVSSAQ